MGLFDVFSYGSKNAIGIKKDYDQIYRTDVENEKMINNEVTRIENDTRDAAERMKRVQLTTGKGVNQKLQTYYDGLTSQLKDVISKNPNYKTDPFQMQQVNGVLNQYADNEIIANDQQSKASYGMYKEMVANGMLSAREIAAHDQKWKQYQDGVIDRFDYSKEHRVDYTKAAIDASQAITQLDRKNGVMRNVSYGTHEKAMQGVFSNPELMDQLLTDFKNDTPLDEQAKWLGIAHKDSRTPEEEEQLKLDVQERIGELSKNNALAYPVLKYASDKFYPYTRQEYDQLSLINQRGMWGGRRKGKSDGEPYSYFDNDIVDAYDESESFIKANPSGKAAFDLKLNAINALFETGPNGLPVSNRMFMKGRGGVMVPLTSNGYISKLEGKERKMWDGKMIVSNGTRRLGATASGIVLKKNYRNFLTSLGFHITPAGDSKVTISRNGVPAVTLPAQDAEQEYIIHHLGGVYDERRSTGMGKLVNSDPGVIVSYDVETDSGVFNTDTREYYDQEARSHKKKYELEADASAGAKPSKVASNPKFSSAPAIK